MLYLFIDKQVFIQRVFLFFFLRAEYVVLSASTRGIIQVLNQCTTEKCEICWKMLTGGGGRGRDIGLI